MYSYGPPDMAVQKQDDQHEHTFSNYVRIQDIVQKTCLRRWTIGKSVERGSGISVLPARHDDDDDVKTEINKAQQNSKCKFRGERDETINHIINGCRELAQIRLDMTGWRRWSTGKCAKSLNLIIWTSSICINQRMKRPKLSGILR